MDTNTTDRSENPAAPGVGSGDLFGTWLSIDTAPRDGTRFLVYDDFEPALESAWIDEEGELRPCSNRSAFWHRPTHWMPLPSLPNIGHEPRAK